MKDVFVLDACAIIAFLSDEEGADKVEHILKEAKKGKCNIYYEQDKFIGNFLWDLS